MPSFAQLGRRVAALEAERRRREQACDPVAIRKRLELSVERGTATLEEYKELFAEEIECERHHLVALTPMLLACRKASLYIDSAIAVLGLPPDQSPSGPTVECWEQLEYSTARDLSARPKRMMAPIFDDMYNAEGRASAAILLLALGPNYGLSLRGRSWTQTGGHWSISEDALTGAEEDGLTLAELEPTFGPGRVIQTDGWTPAQDVLPEHLREPVDEDDETWVAFSILAELVGARFPGQIGSDRLN